MEHDGTEYIWESKRWYPGELHDGWHIPGWLSAAAPLAPAAWPSQAEMFLVVPSHCYLCYI